MCLEFRDDAGRAAISPFPSRGEHERSTENGSLGMILTIGYRGVSGLTQPENSVGYALTRMDRARVFRTFTRLPSAQTTLTQTTPSVLYHGRRC